MCNNNQPAVIEITVLSAQNLKTTSSTFSRRLRPFVSLSTTTPATPTTTSGKHMKMYKTRVDDKGGVNPTWGDVFQLSLDNTFFNQRHPGIYIQLYTKRLLMGQTQLGWCLIPASDVVNRFSPVGYTSFLSYRLRARDGSRGHGVVNIAVKLIRSVATPYPPRAIISSTPYFPEINKSDLTVIGIPMTLRNFPSRCKYRISSNQFLQLNKQAAHMHL